MKQNRKLSIFTGMESINLASYSDLFDSIANTYILGKVKAIKTVNSVLIDTYWQIGKHIVTFEQGGVAKAEYGAALLEKLSKDLSLRYGKGFSLSNLKRFRQFYLVYPIGATLSHQLTWSHYVELLKIENELERSFYEKQTIADNWSIRELIRQKETSLFLRLASHRNKNEILQLAGQGQVIEKPEV